MLYFLRKAFSFNKAKKCPLAAYQFIPNLLKLEDRITPAAPTVLSINRLNGTSASTSASFQVTFDQTVTGVDSTDFSITKTGSVIGASISSVTGSGSTYTVNVTGINGEGSLSLNLINNGTIKNISNQLLINSNTFNQSTFSTGSRPFSVAIADINGDNNLDLISVGFNSRNASILLGNGDGSFQNQIGFSSGGNGNNPFTVAVADFNGDGKPDIATEGYFNNELRILLNNSIPGENSIAFQSSFSAGSTGIHPLSLVAGDLNRDGIVDIATANAGANNVSVFFGNGNGTFKTPTTFATGLYPRDIAFADINGDGKLDVITTNNDGNTITILRNNTSTGATVPNFVARTITTGTSPEAISIADINSDGKLDIVTISHYGTEQNINVHINSGTMGSLTITFATKTTIAIPSGNGDITIGDVNYDGKMDIVTATNGKTSLFLGNGNGSFQASTSYAIGNNPRSVALGDINHDNRIDMITANDTDSTLSVLINTSANLSQPFTIENVHPSIIITSSKSLL